LKKRRPVALFHFYSLFHTLKERLQNPAIIFGIGLFSNGFNRTVSGARRSRRFHVALSIQVEAG
jgi:hypothetical protein